MALTAENITNYDIAKNLDITVRSVQNKRHGRTKWTFNEYILLIKFYGEEIANELINKEELENELFN